MKHRSINYQLVAKLNKPDDVSITLLPCTYTYLCNLHNSLVPGERVLEGSPGLHICHVLVSLVQFVRHIFRPIQV